MNKEKRVLNLKRKTTGFIALVAALALCAVAVAPASAEVVPAKFSSSTFKLTTSGVTAKRNGADPRTCTPSGGAISGSTSSSSFLGSGFGSKFNCSGPSELLMTVGGEAKYDTVSGEYYLLFNASNTPVQSPWGWYEQTTARKATWVNGSGATQSTLKFSNTTIGHLQSDFSVISLDGSFTATTSVGGLLTLSH
jgi:hypothetical protein